MPHTRTSRIVLCRKRICRKTPDEISNKFKMEFYTINLLFLLARILAVRSSSELGGDASMLQACCIELNKGMIIATRRCQWRVDPGEQHWRPRCYQVFTASISPPELFKIK